MTEAKYYITKYALTKGIYIVLGRISEYNHLMVKDRPLASIYPGEYAESLEKALEQAEAMRVKKLAGLKKRQAKYESYSPKIHELGSF